MATSTERVREWRLANPEKWKEHQRRYRKKNKKPAYVPLGRQLSSRLRRTYNQAHFDNLKLEMGCSCCGYDKCAAALDFHHLNPKEKRGRIVANNFQSELGIIEMKKCILVCKNCHYELHN